MINLWLLLLEKPLRYPRDIFLYLNKRRPSRGHQHLNLEEQGIIKLTSRRGNESSIYVQGKAWDLRSFNSWAGSAWMRPGRANCVPAVSKSAVACAAFRLFNAWGLNPVKCRVGFFPSYQFPVYYWKMCPNTVELTSRVQLVQAKWTPTSAWECRAGLAAKAFHWDLPGSKYLLHQDSSLENKRCLIKFAFGLLSFSFTFLFFSPPVRFSFIK